MPVWLTFPRGVVLGIITVIVGTAYLLWTPAAPDLAAQVARADAARAVGTTTWWTGWFGGVSLPNYSIVAQSWMAFAGVPFTGLLAVLAGSLATTRLVQTARRPHAGAVAGVAAQVADLLDGRVTFAVGVAVAAWSVVALRAHRSLLCVAGAAATFAASPLAGLFLGIVLLAVACTDETQRRTSVAGAVVLVAAGGATAFLLPGTGTMPFHGIDAVAPIAACVGVVLTCRVPVLRVTAVLLLASVLACFLYPGSIGENITRLAWIGAAPAVVACSTTPSVRTLAMAVCLTVWPAGDLIGQLHTSAAASSRMSFYRPVETEVNRLRAAAGPSAAGRRTEVVDTASHWGSAYLSSLSLARGWDRQVDRAVNPIFYHRGALTAASYRRWLDQLAVGWVALPSTDLDYASVDEGALINTGLSYLSLAWSSPDWRVYRVRAPTQLVSGARLVAVGAGSVVVRTVRPAIVDVRARWSTYLAVQDAASGVGTPSCLFNVGGWVRLYLPRAETVRLISIFDPVNRWQGTDADCMADLGKAD